MSRRPAPGPAGSTARRDEIVGMYRVIAAPQGGRARGAAFAGMRRVALADGADLDAAFEAVAGRLAERMAAHRASRVDGWPSAAEYRDAIEAAPLSGSSRLTALLQSHVRRPEALATWADLAAATGLADAEVRLEYARLGRKLQKFLNLTAEAGLGRELAPVSTFAMLGTGGAATAVQLRPQVVEALSDL